MSEKAEQNAPERCSCCTCGYTWVKGQHGGHSCAQVMEVTVADLRARLAKYEDAEGRPLQPAADLARRIDQAITEFTSGRACMHVPPRDTDVDIVLSECLKLANALESQAREIERLKRSAQTNWNEFAEGMKAQPSGVVLGLMRAVEWHSERREAFTEQMKNDEAAYSKAKEDGANEARVNALLARWETSSCQAANHGDYAAELERMAKSLNSSPVSARNDPIRYWFIGGAGQEAGSRHCKKSSHDGSLAFFESELDAKRAARRHPGTEVYAVEYYRGSQSLSAPSHGEQVREWCEGVEAAVNLIDKKAEDYATEHGHDDMGGLSFGTGQHAQIKADYHSSLIELAAEVLGLIAAAPSAGSQGGDV